MNLDVRCDSNKASSDLIIESTQAETTWLKLPKTQISDNRRTILDFFKHYYIIKQCLMPKIRFSHLWHK